MSELLAQQAPPSPQPTAPAAAQPGGGAPGQAPQGGCGMDPSFLVLMLLMYGVVWFLVIRPQGKAEKARKSKISGVQKGDRVRTRGGIIAPVVKVRDDEVVLRLDGDTRVELTVSKAYLDEVMPAGGDAEKKD